MNCPDCRAGVPDGKRFCGDCGTRLAPVASAEASRSSRSPPARLAERRQLTVLFSDLVDSTGLATRMDPEDLRELLEAYRGTVDSIVRNRGGCVAQHLGDGVLAFFGYPRADESDVERAVRTGLALVDAVARIGTGERRLQARVGIATGIVVVCSETDTATAGEASATGYPLHLAARLQSLAPAGSVVVADATRRLAPGLFDFHDLGARRLPGFAHPVQAWQARGESRVESRFRALRSPRTELIGRDEEMRCLATAWSAARGRSGGVVLVGGEAGIGKSRLIDSFQREPERDAPLRLRFHCSPHHVSTAFHPVVARFERAARFRRDDSPRTRRDRLETVLAPGTPDADRDLLLELMSVGDGAAGTAAPPDPRQRRQRVLEAMLRQLVLLASRAPVQLYWEDLHWIDPSSRELVDLLVDRAASMPVLLVLTCRPDFRADWTDRAHVTGLSLSRLERPYNELLVRRLSQDALSPAIVDRIVAETDGVPLFVEELTRSALEHPSLFDPSAARVDALRSTLPAPESLLATLTARIDRLGPAREIAQVAAVLGREFSFELLQAVSEWPAPRLRTALGELLESGLVLPGDARTDTTYVFKHALVRDAAYDSLLRTQRVRWHGAAARALVELHRDRVEQHLDALAHHAFEAGEWGDAIRYLTRGSAKAFSTAAFEEAAAMLERAVDASRRLPDEPSTWRCRLALLLRLHDSLLPLARYERMREVLEDAERHAERLGDSASLARIHGSHSHRLWITGSDVDVAAEAANRSLREGRAAGDDARPWLATSFILGQIEHSRGDLLAAARALRRTIDGARRRAVGERFSLYFGVVARSWLAMTLADMGDGVAACACAREAVDLAESAHDPVATIAARFGWGRARLGCGDGPEALAIAREALALPQMRWLVQWRVPLETLEGEALIACGDPRRAIDALSRTASLHDRSGLLAHHSLTLALLADAMGRAGRYEDAERAATIAMETSARRKEENFRCLAQLVRCAARARRGGGDMGDIARVLTDGLLRCRRSQARPLELRYATELSSLHERDRRRDDAASRAAAAAALASGIDRPERSP